MTDFTPSILHQCISASKDTMFSTPKYTEHRYCTEVPSTVHLG